MTWLMAVLVSFDPVHGGLEREFVNGLEDTL